MGRDWNEVLMEVSRINSDRNLGMSTDQLHVEAARQCRTYLVKRPIPAAVRKAFFAAVKGGELCRLPKDAKRRLPEVFYHPNFEHLANGDRVSYRDSEMRAAVSACRAVLA